MLHFFFFFHFRTLNISCLSCLPHWFSDKLSVDSFMVFPLYMTIFGFFSCFSAICITTCCYFNYYVSCPGDFWFDFSEGSLCHLYLDVYFLPQIRKKFNYYLFKYIFCSLFSVFSLWDSYSGILLTLMMLLSSLYLFSIFYYH